jgi:hypothetical protein
MPMIRMLPSKRRSHIMLVNIDAEMSEILSVYPHFQNLAAPFHSVEHEHWVTEVGRSLYAKGGGDLVRKVLIELRHAPEDYSEDFLSYLTMKWPAN